MSLMMSEELLNATLMDMDKNRKRRHSDNDFSDDEGSSPKSHTDSVDDDRRAHHNELERRRRDHIKDHFMALKDAIPLLEGEKCSRALILKRAIDYISMMKSKMAEQHNALAEMARKNELLEAKLSDRRVTVSSISPSSVPSMPRFPTTVACSSTAAVPVSPIALPTFKPQPQFHSIQAPISSNSLTSLESLRLNGLLPPSQDNLLALTQMMLNQTRFTPANPICPSSIVPDLHTRLLANSLALRDHQFSQAVQF